MKITNKDIIILRELMKDSSKPTRKIANKVQMPISTVHRRKKEMEKAGVIRRYTAEVSMEDIGFPVGFLLLINRKEGLSGDEIKKKTGSIENVVNVFEVKAGPWDFVVEAYARSMEDAGRAIDKIKAMKGIQEVSVMFITDKNWMFRHGQ